MNLPRIPTLLAAMALLVLPACTIVSETPLITAAETAALANFPESFSIDFYDEDGATDFKRPEKPTPMTFALNEGGGYAAADASMAVHFVPRADGRQLIWVSAPDGNMYGVGEISDSGVLELHMVMSEDPAAAFAAITMPADIGKDITLEDGGISVRSRAALDFVVELVGSGQIAKAPMIGFMSLPGDPLPARIVKDGEGWALEN